MAGLLTVWASSQVPHQVRQFVCDLLGLPPHCVRVLAPDVGGGFGAKLIVYPEDVLIPLLALRLGRPVRWLEDRLEHMLAATQERTQTHAVEVGFDDEGRLRAIASRTTRAPTRREAWWCRSSRPRCWPGPTGSPPWKSASMPSTPTACR
jgi:CO/xanthine dehydrogenase Mo-binding subunit